MSSERHKMQTIRLVLFLLILATTSPSIANHHIKESRMKDNTLTILIDKPIETVFEFTVNPHNTP